MATTNTNYLTARGLSDGDPQALNTALQLVLDSMEPLAYGDATTGLTAEEQAVLRDGGLMLEATPGPDPLAQTAVKYAAIIERSLSAKGASERLELAGSRIRQMIADRSLYSFLVNGVRYVPEFQFVPGGKLVPNIVQVNRVVNPKLHPVEVYNWLHLPNDDLFLHDDMEDTVSPLDWLRSGQDTDLIVRLAGCL
ncbi:MAG: hypothetical protein ACR2RB_02735 [Gammaproteobacteria bacterium]